MSDNMEKGRKRSRKKKILALILIPLLVVLISVTGYATYLTNTAKNVVENSHHEIKNRAIDKKSNKREKAVDPSVDSISILFMGIDDSAGESGRTDAMILATFNEDEKSVKMVSIPRDSRVELVGRDVMDKITHAHVYGGIQMAVESVEHLFDVPVDYYVRLNFSAFIEIVDALGGVEIDVPFEIIEQDSDRNKNAIHLHKGLQLLNGEEALAYARTRKYDGDIERGKRQEEVLTAIIKKLASVQSVTKYNDVLESIGDNLTTNMTFEEMTSFHDYAYEGANIEIETMTLEGRGARIKGLWYYLLDDESVESISQKLKKHLDLNESDVSKNAS